MQKFQNLSTKMKVTIAVVALAGVIGGVSWGVHPLLQHQEIPFVPTPTPIQCALLIPQHGGGVQCLDQWVTPDPSANPDATTQP